MHKAYVLHYLGLLLALFSLTMLPPLAIAVWFHEGIAHVFALSTFLLISIGLILWLPTQLHQQTPNSKDSFFIVVTFWVILCFAGVLPFFLSIHPNIGFVDALFESVSGLTTTGATVLSNIDRLPKSLLFYRQELQFLGGLSIILLAVAILPALGVGGLQLFRAEITGLAKETRLTPRIAQTAKGIWMIYISLNIFCTIAFWAGGMDFFDAVCMSFSTVSTGGFATHDQNFAYFNSPLLQSIAICFMILGGANFMLHYVVLQTKGLQKYWKDVEFRTFLIFLAIGSLLVIGTLLYHQTFVHSDLAIIEGAFQVVSMLTTTGYTSSSFYQWPLYTPIFLILIGLIGGCSGSTSGGIKIIRVFLLNLQGLREIKRLIHPNAHYVIKLNKKILSDKVISAIWGYLATFIALFGLIFLLLLGCGLDFISAYSATASSLSNTGPALGQIADSYESISDTAKLILCFAMLIGRLEIFTILVLFTPTYWQS